MALGGESGLLSSLEAARLSKETGIWSCEVNRSLLVYRNGAWLPSLACPGLGSWPKVLPSSFSDHSWFLRLCLSSSVPSSLTPSDLPSSLSPCLLVGCRTWRPMHCCCSFAEFHVETARCWIVQLAVDSVLLPVSWAAAVKKCALMIVYSKPLRATSPVCAFSPGQYHCPVLYSVFTDNTHIVAIRTTGNVYTYEVDPHCSE